MAMKQEFPTTLRVDLSIQSLDWSLRSMPPNEPDRLALDVSVLPMRLGRYRSRISTTAFTQFDRHMGTFYDVAAFAALVPLSAKVLNLLKISLPLLRKMSYCCLYSFKAF